MHAASGDFHTVYKCAVGECDALCYSLLINTYDQHHILLRLCLTTCGLLSASGFLSFCGDLRLQAPVTSFHLALIVSQSITQTITWYPRAESAVAMQTT